MALINVVKKVKKAGSEKTGIRPGEDILAACTTNPAGTVNKMVSKEVAGIVGAMIGDRARSGDADLPGGGLAERFVNGQNFVVLTDQRLLLMSMSAMSGKPKELLAEWNRDELASIKVDKGTLACPFTISFVDGSAVQVEGAKGTNPRSVEEAFNSKS